MLPDLLSIFGTINRQQFITFFHQVACVHCRYLVEIVIFSHSWLFQLRRMCLWNIIIIKHAFEIVDFHLIFDVSTPCQRKWRSSSSRLPLIFPQIRLQYFDLFLFVICLDRILIQRRLNIFVVLLWTIPGNQFIAANGVYLWLYVIIRNKVKLPGSLRVWIKYIWRRAS